MPLPISRALKRTVPFPYENTEWKLPGSQLGSLCPAPESQQLGQLKHGPLPEGSLELGGPWVALLFFFNLSNGESIEILVSPFFCLSPTHMVLSLVSYFSFLSLKKKNSFSPPGGQNWPFKQSSFLVSKEVSPSQKSLKRKSADPTHGKDWRFP